MYNFKRHRHRSYSYLLILVILSLIIAPIWSTTAQAGKEGVYLSHNIYFTLSDVQLSASTDAQSLRFALNLVNDSDQVIDYNAYGARVTDSRGSSYSVQLSEKTAARVQPHKSQAFKYSSTITSGLLVSDLRVILFAWDSSEADYMRDLGSLSVGEAVSDQTIAKQPLLILNLNETDATLPVDASVSIEPINSTKVVKDGVWTMYVDLRIENLGSSGYKLPVGITYQLVDARGLYFTATATAGNDTLLPKQTGKLTLQANVGGSFTNDQFSIQILNKNQTATELLGSLSVVNSDPLQVGEVHDWPSQHLTGVSISLNRASFKTSTDGIIIESIVDIVNKGKSIVTLPALSASYQGNINGLSITASDSIAESFYLSPNESLSQTFRATLPIGSDLNETSLILFEKKGGASTAALLPLVSFNLSGADSTESGVITPAKGTIVKTSAGSLAIEWQQTQRLTLESDDVLLSEFTVRNITSNIVTLPALYGGFSIGDFEVTGKAIRLQSSAYINPNETTTIYLYSKIPYTLEATKGSIFLGEGTTQGSGGVGANAGGQANTNNAAVVTPTQEWLRASYSIQDDGIPIIAKSSEWTISDQGRGSVGSIIDSQVFTLASSNQKMLAVRMIQTGKEKRIGNIVPYLGYFVGPDGSIWNAKVTEDAGRFCNGCVALTTLWVALPEVVSQSLTEYDLVFGQKLDDTALTSVRRYKLTNLGSQLPMPVAKAITASDTQVVSYISNATHNLGTFDLYPYQVTFNNLSAFRLITTSSARYEINFTYTGGKLYPVAGGNKNRSLVIELRDSNDVLMKTWEYPFEGTGSLVNGNIKLTADVANSPDITPTYAPRAYVYEKFEGGLRLLGSNTVEIPQQ